MLCYIVHKDVCTSCLVNLIFFLYFVFFFQAEDGIRDTSVTGVQTCALPIFETATLIPRALKLCVGLSDSSLTQRSTSSVPQARDARSSGVPPSPSETGSTSGGNGKTSR